MNSEATELFLRLWDGYDQRHIELDGSNRSKEASGKIKVKTATVEGPLTPELVWAHFNGKASIGVAPVKADSTCRFGVLDIDWYDMPEDDVVRVRDRLRTMCAGFRSKSRGLHVYVFTSEPVPAQVMHDYLVTLRKRLPKDIQKKTEIFPKESQTRVGPNDEPTAVNLPLKETQRELVFLIDETGIRFVQDDQSPIVTMRHIDAHCRIDAKALTEIVGETPSMDGSDIGYRVPKDPKGRNDLLMRIAMSMQARGWTDKEMDLEINRLNKEGNKSDDDMISSVMTSPLDQGEIDNLLKQAKKREKGAAALVHYRQIEKFNDRWSKITIHGQVEYVDKYAPQFTTFKKEALFDETSDQTVRMGKAVVPLAKVWMQDVDHARFKEVVCEPVDYAGPGYNVWKGFAVVPKAGDPAIFTDYIENVLCSGDAALARWLTMWLADACQRPTEPSPPTAVAMRGPQGAGKSFLQEQVLTRIFGERHVYKVQQASRMFAQFNRSMFGATFVAAEESIFHGSAQMAATLKDFISSPSWTYEEKFKAAFPQKNVHRLIATTNEDQAVHIDFDDRRWTVIAVPQRFDMLSDEGKAAARAFWEPYHAFMKSDDGPGIVLRYLLDYPVDRGQLLFGHGTDAKKRDKVASDPVLAVLDDIAAKGYCPDDVQAIGVVSSPTFCRLVKENGGTNMSPKAIMMRVDKLIPQAKPVTNARVLRAIVRSVKDGYMDIREDLEGGQRGRDLGPLAEFRHTVARLTGDDYQDGKERWHAWNVLIDVPDPNANMPY